MGSDKKYVYLFSEGSKEMVDLLGGKGAGLAEMTSLHLNVPAGFTITTEACREFQRIGKFPDGLMDQVKNGFEKIEKQSGKKFGDPDNPLLVSVRSGAKISMPGMMDTVLNVGLNDHSVSGLSKKFKNERFAMDSYRRLKQMFGEIVLSIPHSEFMEALDGLKEKLGILYDYELSVENLKELIKIYDKIYSKHDKIFPQDPWKQLEMAIEAVFHSWNSERAKVYRELNRIPDDLGTAVNIVEMVFGNMGENSATGVAFTRDPNTGEKRIVGEFLQNAQGEDVVAGIRTPRDVREMEVLMPVAYRDFLKSCDILERHYRDMQDIEFTVENGKFYLLQTRSGKRSARAAVRIAVEMYRENLISLEEAVMRITPETLDILFHPQVKYNGKENILGKGLAASPGAASGSVYFSSEDAIEAHKSGKKIILVRQETTADDVRGMAVSEGFLTQKGGMTSHAAVVARAMGKPAVVGAEKMTVNLKEKFFSINGTTVREGEVITVDGTSGNFILGKCELEVIKNDVFTDELLSMADKIRKLGIRANANTPEEAQLARKNGAEGIGLARTERMFLGNERIGIMRAMIMSRTREEREAQLSRLMPMQVHDFEEFFRTMDGFPVIIRLLDPPLHEFLPDTEEIMEEIFSLKFRLTKANDTEELEKILNSIREKEDLLNVVKSLREFNPMLGFRGCRLGIVYPEIYNMQARAIMRAAMSIKKEGKKILPEIMVPLIGTEKEMENLRTNIENSIKQELGNDFIEYKIGTMIEIPRACVTADKIAKHAEFFSFGTNDLTQMTFGYSRDDAEGKFIPRYLDEKIIPNDPFRTLDTQGVGQLMEMAVKKGKSTRKDLEIGICGEQGGDPETIYFCRKINLDYVSASPFRIPIARLAAARAEISLKDQSVD
ncbi:pyruvate, phosphate dikinase [Caldiplasma sukawensis]